MTDGVLDVQEAIYSVLTSYSPTVAGGRVYDLNNVPEAPTYPFVAIGDVVADETDADLSSGTDETLTIEVYSRLRGKFEVLDIMQEIKDALHKQSLSVSGRSALAWWAGSITRQDPDGVTTQGIVRIRIISRAAL